MKVLIAHMRYQQQIFTSGRVESNYFCSYLFMGEKSQDQNMSPRWLLYETVHLKCHWIQWIPLNSMGPIFRQLEPLLTNLVRHFFQISFLSEWVLIPPKLILLDRWGQKIFLAGENNEGHWPMCLLYRLNSLIIIVMLSTYSVKAWTVYVVTYSL